jgi:hypothetical protein
MTTNRLPVPERHINTAKTSAPPLFDLGQVVATPAVLDHLEKHGLYPSVLLGQHCHGDWGLVCARDARSNDEAILNGGRILSAYKVEDVRIWVITEAENGEPDRQRTSTCLLLPEEY